MKMFLKFQISTRFRRLYTKVHDLTLAWMNNFKQMSQAVTLGVLLLGIIGRVTDHFTRKL